MESAKHKLAHITLKHIVLSVSVLYDADLEATWIEDDLQLVTDFMKTPPKGKIDLEDYSPWYVTIYCY